MVLDEREPIEGVELEEWEPIEGVELESYIRIISYIHLALIIQFYHEC